MIRLVPGPAGPTSDDLCLVHSFGPGPHRFHRPGGRLWVPRSEVGLEGPGLFVGEAQGRPVWAIEAPGAPAEDPAWVTLRQVLAEAPADEVQAAVRAAELAAWDRDHRFCGRCGGPTGPRAGAPVRDCPSCGAEHWPRITPAVIMVVHRGDEILLARHTRHTRPGAPSFASCLAGFVEAGETLEEAVAREVAEESGLTVGRPVYHTSQAWPFPHALMVGFHVPWVSGEPKADGVEIAEVGWYRRGRLPELPPSVSIARQLIRAFFQDPNL